MRKKSRAFVFCRVRNILENIAYLDNRKSAFSLMEMMVVLLIVAILAAATAPMVTKKMARNAGAGDSPWVFTGLNNSIAYNLNGNDNAPVIIGASSTPASLAAPTRLFIDSGNTASHIAFGNGNATPLGITVDPANGRIGISNQQIPNSSIAFGAGQTISNNPTGIIALGQNVKVEHGNDIVIGYKAQSLRASDANFSDVCNIVIGGGELSNVTNKETMARNGSIAIGTGTRANGEKSIAIGHGGAFQPYGGNGPNNPAMSGMQTGTTEAAKYSIALGLGSKVAAHNGIAIGTNTVVTNGHDNSVAIGPGASTTAKNQIVLGTKDDTVYIPGTLVVGQRAFIGVDWTGQPDNNANVSSLAIATKVVSRGTMIVKGQVIQKDESQDQVRRLGFNDNCGWSASNIPNFTTSTTSDRRLKNVGEAYTAGLDELKKLEFFHYTFKKDEAKTPHVGVMAQDLEKVFPNAVTKGEDGYLRIRMEDMFYAVINAVKELDTKITEIVENVTSLSKKVDEQQQIIEAQQKMIEELQAQNANIEKRLAKFEKKSKKVAE